MFKVANYASDTFYHNSKNKKGTLEPRAMHHPALEFYASWCCWSTGDSLLPLENGKMESSVSFQPGPAGPAWETNTGSELWLWSICSLPNQWDPGAVLVGNL